MHSRTLNHKEPRRGPIFQVRTGALNRILRLGLLRSRSRLLGAATIPAIVSTRFTRAIEALGIESHSVEAVRVEATSIEPASIVPLTDSLRFGKGSSADEGKRHE